MKKFILSLALISSILHAEPMDAQPDVDQTEISAETIEFAAKFKALHAFCISEYDAIEKLFADCGRIYSETFDSLSELGQHENEAVKKKSLELLDDLNPAISDINTLLGRLQELNQGMELFNKMIQEATEYTQVTSLLISIAQEMHTIRVSLEAVKEYEAKIQAEALELAQ